MVVEKYTVNVGRHVHEKLMIKWSEYTDIVIQWLVEDLYFRYAIPKADWLLNLILSTPSTITSNVLLIRTYNEKKLSTN